MKMRPSLILKTLESLYMDHRNNLSEHLNLLIEGPPGCGKTSVVKAFTQYMSEKLGEDFGYCPIHAPTYQPEDLSLPFVNERKSSYRFLVPEGSFPFIPLNGDEEDTWPECGVICLDEMPAGSEAVQKSLANLVLERCIHGRELKPGWMIVATGNRSQDRAGANRVLSHLRDRFTTVEFVVSSDDWIKWYQTTSNWKQEAVAFIRAQPDMLQKFDPSVDVSPTARSWVNGVFNRLGVIPEEAEAPMFEGAVGSAAQLFRNFIKMWRDWPDPDGIISDPKKYPIPSGDDEKQGRNAGAICYGIAGVLAHKATRENIDKIMTYLTRKEMPAEYMVLAVKMMLQRDATLGKTQTMREWVGKYGNELVSM